MSDLIFFIVIALVGALISAESKKRKAVRKGQPNDPPRQPPQKKGSFADLVQQFDQQRVQSLQEHTEGLAKPGSLQYETTEGYEPTDHDHGFNPPSTMPVPGLPREGGYAALVTGAPRERWKESAPQRPVPTAQSTLRQAIIMAEVLGRPVSQRRRP